MEPGPQRIGGKYLKAMYRQFTDATFTHRVPRPEWMGFLGPILSGEQGDTIRIVFKNMAYQAGRNFSMHPHGAQYTKENEGETILFAFFHRSFHYLPSEPNQAVFNCSLNSHRSFRYLPSEPNQAVFSSLNFHRSFCYLPSEQNQAVFSSLNSNRSFCYLPSEPNQAVFSSLNSHRSFCYLPCEPNQAVFSSLPIDHFAISPVSRTGLYSVLSPSTISLSLQ